MQIAPEFLFGFGLVAAQVARAIYRFAWREIHSGRLGWRRLLRNPSPALRAPSRSGKM